MWLEEEKFVVSFKLDLLELHLEKTVLNIMLSFFLPSRRAYSVADFYYSGDLLTDSGNEWFPGPNAALAPLYGACGHERPSATTHSQAFVKLSIHNRLLPLIMYPNLHWPSFFQSCITHFLLALSQFLHITIFTSLCTGYTYSFTYIMHIFTSFF